MWCKVKKVHYRNFIIIVFFCLQWSLALLAWSDERLLIMNSRFVSQPTNPEIRSVEKEIQVLSEVLNEFTEVQNSMKAKIQITNTSGYLTELGITGVAATISAVPVIGPFGTAVAGQILKDSVSLATRSLVEHWEAKSIDVLEQGLIKYRETHSQEKLNQLTHQNAGAIYNEVFGDKQIFENEAYRKMNEKEKLVYHNFLFKTIGDAIATNDIQNKIEHAKEQAYVEGKFADVSSKLSQVTQWGVYFQKNISNRLDKAQVQVQNIINNVHDLLDDVHQTKDKTEEIAIGMDQIHELMFGQMSPKQQLEALDKNFLPKITKAQKENLEKTIKVVKQRVELNESVEKFSETLNNIAQIGKNFGVDPNIVSTIEKVNHTLRTGQNAFNAILSQNYLGALSAISGLFGGNESDPLAGRHQAVMNAIGQILEQQKIMNEKLDVVLEGQKIIIDNQKITFDEIIRLHNNLAKVHSDLVDRLNKIEVKLDNLTDLTRTQLESEPNFCFTFLHKSLADLGGPLRLDSLHSFSELASYFSSNGNVFQNCHKGLTSLFVYTDSNPSKFHPLFLMKHYEHSETPVIERFLENVYAPVSNYYFKRVANNKSENSYKDVLYAPIIIKYSHLLLETEPWLQMINEHNHLLSQKELVEKKPTLFQQGESNLKTAQKIIETAISQQVFLAGELIIDDLIIDLENEDLNVRKDLIRILQYNPALATNLFTRYLHYIARSNNMSIYSFIDLLNNKSLTFLCWILRNRFDFIVEQGSSTKAILRINPMNNLGVNDDDLVINIAQAQNIENNQLVFHDDMKALVQLRELIINRRAEYLYLKNADFEKISILQNTFSKFNVDNVITIEIRWSNMKKSKKVYKLFFGGVFFDCINILLFYFI